MRILIALLAIGVGLGLVFNGYHLARFIIPIWGFISGFALGGAMMADITGTAFLSSLFSILVGLIMGLIFALLSYFYYAAAVVVTAGLLGYWAGSSLMFMFGLDPGFLSVSVGLIVGIALGVVALMANAPKYVLVIITAIAGAVTTIGGVLLLFNVIPLEFFSYTASRIAVSNSFFWSLVALGLAGIGAVIQARMPSSYSMEKWITETGPSHGHSTGPMSPTHTR